VAQHVHVTRLWLSDGQAWAATATRVSEPP
jgi:hypothetical protein